MPKFSEWVGSTNKSAARYAFSLLRPVQRPGKDQAVELQAGNEGAHFCQVAIVIRADDVQLPVAEAMLNRPPRVQQRCHAFHRMDTSQGRAADDGRWRGA